MTVDVEYDPALDADERELRLIAQDGTIVVLICDTELSAVNVARVIHLGVDRIMIDRGN
jgi:hypothetical protein